VELGYIGIKEMFFRKIFRSGRIFSFFGLPKMNGAEENISTCLFHSRNGIAVMSGIFPDEL